MTARSEAWYRLRSSRADPPGRARDDSERRRRYQAALQQAEELWVAAQTAGPAGRPLPLFYFLAQAGRAIVAACGGDEASCHGLRDPDLTDPFLDSTVSPQGNGWFQTVADATRSPQLPAGVELGALMASLPELADLDGVGDRWPPALRVWPGPFPVDVLSSGYQQMSQTYRVPGVVVFRGLPGCLPEVEEALGPYPDATDTEPTLERWPTPAGDGYILRWKRADPSADPLPPAYGGDRFRWMRPNLPVGTRPPSVLMTWWAVLFALSMLARYHPVEWVTALDPDTSRVAVVLERTMEVALEVVPGLVLEAMQAPAGEGEQMRIEAAEETK